MQNPFDKTLAPCIVNEGTLINKTDIIRALETLENVRYSFIVDGNIISEGSAVVCKVFISQESSTLIINGCAFINVLSFNYMRFYTDEKNQTTIELVENAKILRLTAIEEDSRKSQKSNQELLLSTCYDEEAHVELFDDFDEDDRL